METGDSGYCCDMAMELLIEILIRLPLKSLIRFTIVCKSWLHLIRNDQQFAMRHYLTKTRPSPTTLMDNVDCIVEYFGKYGRRCKSTVEEEVLRLCIHSLTEKKTFRLLKKLEFGPRLNVSVSNTYHGLLCVYASSSSLRGARILLCNPAIREVVLLPLPHNLATSSLPIIAIGFDPINTNYKVVAAQPPSVFGGRSSWEVNLYSVRDGCWRSLPSIGSLDRFSSLICEPVVNANGRVINWFGYLKSTESEKGLLSFDVVDEVFVDLSMPACLCPKSWRVHHILTSRGCEACLCCSPFPSFVQKKDEHFNGIDVWMLSRDEDQQMLWNKQFSFNLQDNVVVWPTNLWMNDNEVLLHVRKGGANKEEVCHYNLFANELKRTGRFGLLTNPDGYAESLISIKELMSPPSSSYLQAMRDEQQKEKDEVCFIREVGRKNTDVRWSYTFKLV
ncbi:unnamed protein product [Cuscuta campestris]|uniref:Uncharacterized protein n=1 Tax=Cuscuta campestris TaxID=132261 RepID=A0A484KI55_9ASTE|nr:unnamed protein product [Cuscuta campestris]